MSHVLITRGLPASGKTTWSKTWVRKHSSYKRINRDDLRMMMYDGVWTKKREVMVLEARESLIRTFLFEACDIVLDDTNLVPERLNETIHIIETWAEENRGFVHIEIKDFIKIPLKLCLQRNAERPDETRVPEQFIRDYYNKYVTKLLKDRGHTSWTISY